jgi:regulatory protein
MDGREAAFEAAVKMLARRAMSELEVREKLSRRGHGEDDVGQAVARLTSAGYIDDRRAALETILSQSRRGHGPLRVDARLRARGIRDEVIAGAWREAAEDYGVDPHRLLAEQLQRRLPDGASHCDRALLSRVYNALLRAGFDESEVRSVLAPRLPDPDATDEMPADGPAERASRDRRSVKDESQR